MSEAPSLRLAVLPEQQQRLWPQLAVLRPYGFVLYGVTAIALRYGHRESVDFDLFTEHPIDMGKLASLMPRLSEATVLQEERNTVVALLDGVKISLYGHIRFGRVAEPDDHHLPLASPLDLFGTKLKVIIQRAEAKDYLDIHQLMRSGLSLGQGLGAASALYGSAFQPAEALKALCYFKDGDLHTLPLEIRQFLQSTCSRDIDIVTITRLSSSLGGKSSPDLVGLSSGQRLPTLR